MEFLQHVEFWRKGPLSKNNGKEHCNYLMIWIGDKGRDIYSTLNLSQKNCKKFSVIKEKFEDLVKPKSNRVYSRYRFLSRTQMKEKRLKIFSQISDF